MSLLMPEYERQLRAAARRLAGDSLAAAKPARGRLGSWLVLSVAGALTVAVAAAAVVLIAHRAPPSNGGPATALPATQYDCAPQAVRGSSGAGWTAYAPLSTQRILRTRGPLTPVAHGIVGGQRWTLEIDSARHGVPSVQAGRLLLGKRAYGFCKTRLEVELVNAGPHGIVYGLAVGPYQPPFVVQASTRRGTATHPVPAHNYPATTRRVPGADLFLRALPGSACKYRDLGMSAADRTTAAGVGRSVLTITKFTHSCAPGQLRQTR